MLNIEFLPLDPELFPQAGKPISLSTNMLCAPLHPDTVRGRLRDPIEEPTEFSWGSGIYDRRGVLWVKWIWEGPHFLPQLDFFTLV